MKSGVVAVAGNRIEVSSSLNTQALKDEVIQALTDSKPADVELQLEITAPLQIIRPYTFHMIFSPDGHEVKSCHSETVDGLSELGKVLDSHAIEHEAVCKLAKGQPVDDWPELITNLINALAAMGNNELMVSDRSVSIVFSPDTPKGQLDDIEGVVKDIIPHDFIMRVVTADNAQEVEKDLLVIKEPDGLVSVYGNVPDQLTQNLILELLDSYLLPEQVSDFLTVSDESKPLDLDALVSGLQAFEMLYAGTISVQDDLIAVEGTALTQDDRNRIKAIVTSVHGPGNFSLRVTVDDEIRLAGLPSLNECTARIDQVLAETRITFDSGSNEINEATAGTIKALAPVLQECLHFKWEIGGHTDSSGRASKNLQLSQDRANAILYAINLEGVISDNLVAVGYGEEFPIASNNTREGRAENRRIVIQHIADDNN